MGLNRLRRLESAWPGRRARPCSRAAAPLVRTLQHISGIDVPATEGTILSDITTPESTPEVPSFAELGVAAPLLESLNQAGITSPFPIQVLAIPLGLDGNDLIGQARTGTGKTLAFAVSTLQQIQIEGDQDVEPNPHPGKPQALVMAPTRELAIQVARDFEMLSTVRKARVLTIYGGVAYEPQLDALASGVDVVVGTPGRLLDLADRRALDLSHVKVIVLDEADEMLDLGFLPDVERLIGKTPLTRQTLLFSATMPAAIMSLARSHLQRPINVRAEGHDAQATVPDTTQFVYQAHDLDKPEVVGRVLQSRDIGKVMVFCKTKRAAQRLADELEDRGFAAAPIHGDLNQAARERALKKFRDGTITVLVATDVAARGIDVSGVSHVINYEVPDDEKTYVHRIGRTGRAGAKGVAITLVDWSNVPKWKLINKQLKLDFEDPIETYSSSAHLFTDLDIPEGTKGRLKPSTAQPKSERRDDHRKDGDRGRRGKDEGRGRRDEGASRRRGEGARAQDSSSEAAERPRRERRRTRSGAEPSAAAASSAGTESEPGQAPRRRRRRRSSGGQGDAASTAPAAE